MLSATPVLADMEDDVAGQLSNPAPIF